MSRVYRIWVTGCGLGQLPIAPATWGSLPGLLLAWSLSMVPWKIRTLGLLLLYAVSWWAIRTLLSAQHADRDPSWIVADEFSALAGLSLLFPIETLSQAGLSFVFFRFWDVCKIFPADWLETLPVPWGILLDDVVALFYTALCLWLLA